MRSLVGEEDVVKQLTQLQEYMSQHAAKEAEVKATSAQEEKDEKISNQYFLQCLDHGLKLGINKPLSTFWAPDGPAALGPTERRYFVPGKDLDRRALHKDDPDGRLRSVIFDDRTGQSRLELLVKRDSTGNMLRPTLHLVSDDGPIGLAGCWYLFADCKLRGTRRNDPWHRIPRFVQAALKSCDLWSTVQDWTIVFNVVHGPWLGDGFFSTLCKAAQVYLARSNWRCPAFQYFYERICRARGWCEADFATQEHMERAHTMLKSSAVLKSKGAHVKLGRWFCYSSVAETKADTALEMALFLFYLGFREKWWASIDTCPLFRSGGSATTAEENREREEANAAGEGASSSSAAAQGPVKLSNAEVDKKADKCKNKLDLVFRLAADHQSYRQMQITRVALGPLDKCFGTWQSECKTIRGNIEVHLGWATKASTTKCMQATLDLLKDIKALQCLDLADLEQLGAGEGDAELDAKITQSFFLCVVSLCGEIAQWSMQFGDSFPCAFYLLLSPDAAVRAKGLEFCRDAWQWLEKAEKAALEDRFMSNILRDMQWPAWCWVRELFIQLAEFQFQHIGKDVELAVKAFAESLSTTHIVEDCFHQLKEMARESSNGTCESVRQWHTLQTCGLAEDYDRKQPTETPTSRSAAAKAMPKTMFDCDVDDWSVGMNKLWAMSGTGTNPSPGRFASMPVVLKSAMLATSVDSLRLSWLSQMASVGCVLVHSSQPKLALVVLLVTRWGVLVWPLKQKGQGVFSFFSVTADNPCPWQYRRIDDLDSWKASSLQAKASRPTTAHDQGQPFSRILLHLDMRPEAIVKFAARKAFVPMQVPDLQKLLTLVGKKFDTPAQRPKTEKDLTICLIREYFPLWSDEEMKQALQHRFAKKVVHSILFDGENLEEVKDLLDPLDVKAFTDSKKDYEQKKAGVKACTPKGQGEASASAPPAGGSSSSGAKPRPKVSLKGSATPACVKKYLPQVPGCSTSLDIVRHNRWVISYPNPTPPYSVSKAFADESAVTRSEAFLFCLRQVWAWHEKQHPKERCPWDLSELVVEHD